MDKLQRYKQEVDEFLASFLSSKQKDFAKVNAWGPDAIEKIQSVVSEGKTIRGSLVLFIHDAMKGKNRTAAVRVAASYELIQTGLIVHDDIMDHDVIRRGKPALYVQYKSEALAMCVGDLLFFLAHELLSETNVQSVSDQIFQEVCVAQMQDVSLKRKKTLPIKDEVRSLYLYKTARYTFSLPMMAAAILARSDKKTVDALEKLGEAMGLLFQIRDDELDGSELKLTDSIAEFTQRAKNLIRKLPMDITHKKELAALVDFCRNRNK